MTYHKRGILRKFFAVTIIGVMVFATDCSFALEQPRIPGLQIEQPSEQAAQAEKAIRKVMEEDENEVGNEAGNDLAESSKAFVNECDGVSIEIPKDPKDGIAMDNENGADVSMKLPDVISCEEGENVNGTVIYDSKKKDLAVAVQCGEGDSEIEGGVVRTMLVIETADAPKEYRFGFDLKKGQKLISSEESGRPDCDDLDAEMQPGYVYVKDGDEVICEIQPAWAKDADGNDVSTRYEIRGNDLVQIVDLDKKTKFPVVADPAMSGYYYKKSGVKISSKWGSWKRTSSIMNTYKTKGGTLSTNESFTISGSVSGSIKGISTIGMGTSISSATGRTWQIGKNKRCYVQCRAEYKVETGTRTKISMNSGKVISKNKYTVKRPKGKTYREFGVKFL